MPVPDQAVAANWEIVGALDYNGDGYVHVLWYNPDSGKIVSCRPRHSPTPTTGTIVGPR